MADRLSIYGYCGECKQAPPTCDACMWFSTCKSIAENVKKNPADYSDVVTYQHLNRIKSLVPESDYQDAKVISHPAW